MRRYLWAGQVITYEEAEETVEESILWEKEHGLGIFCMLLEPELNLIGFCGVRFIAQTTDVELLYGLLPAYWKQGFATEASRAMLRYAFGTLNVSHVFAGCDPLNTSSFGVMERLGMQAVPDGTVPVPGAVYYRLERPQWKDYASPLVSRSNSGSP